MHNSSPNSLHSNVIDRPSKQAIKEMPPFVGMALEQVVMVEDTHSLAQAKQLLSGQTLLGFDTESKPTFKPGEKSAGPHLIQFATAGHAILIPVSYLEGVEYALSIIEDKKVMKVGFGLSGDRALFRNRFGASLNNTSDLCQTLKRKYRFKQPVGAKVAVALAFGCKLSKAAQRSNWAAWPLTEQQVLYAANDAYAALAVHQRTFSTRVAQTADQKV